MRYYVRLARYTLEKDILLEFSEDFGLIIPANLVKYYNKSLGSYMKKHQKSYFIDPLTYVFTHPANMLKKQSGKLERNSKGKYKLKKSYEKLVEDIDPYLIEQFIDKIPIQPNYFLEPDNVDRFVKKNIQIQKESLSEASEKISRYEQLIGEESEENDNRLEFFVAPYFYADRITDPWYAINIELINLTREYLGESLFYGVLCINKNILYQRDIAEVIAEDYDNCDGILLFLSDFHSERESLATLSRFKEFVYSLSQETGKPIINLYGAGLSPFLDKYGLSGTASGLCILESRNANEEYGFSIARIKHYIPSSHEKITEDNFRTYLRSFDPIEECKCSFCSYISQIRERYINNQPQYLDHIANLFTSERGFLMKGAMTHFLENRLKEVEKINTLTSPKLLEILHDETALAKRYELSLDTNNFSETILNLLEDWTK